MTMSGSPQRTRLIRAVHAASRQHGLDADARHALQERVTGKPSLTAMSDAQIRQVLGTLNGRPPARNVLPGGPHTSKLRALWISAYWLGVVEVLDDDALASWLKRQTGLDSAAWATPPQTAAAVEALKDWMEREAGVDWSPWRVTGKGGRKATFHNPRARVLQAQARRLEALGVAQLLPAVGLEYISDPDADALIVAWGRLLRGLK